MRETILTRRTAILVAGLAVVSLLAGFAAAIFGGATDVQSHRADSFSSSAIGHTAFLELLRRSGRQVIRSRGRSASKAGSDALLLLLEPSENEDRIAEMMVRADHCLVVLPKWFGRQHRERAGWIETADLEGRGRVQECWDAFVGFGEVVRPGAPVTWSADGFDYRPSLARPQLVEAQRGDRVFDSDRGALLVRLPSRAGASHWVLSDPDLLSNHGLGRGDNAALMIRILERVAPEGSAIVVDETLHGYALAPNIWAELGRFPLALVLGQSLLALGALIWAGALRFGRPQEERSPLTGKEVLVGNTAELLLQGSHSVSVLGRYLRLSERRIGDACRLPSDLTRSQLRERLRRIGEARGVETGIDEVAGLVEAAREPAHGVEMRVLRAARAIRQWTMEMIR